MSLEDLARAHCIRAFLENEPVVDHLIRAMLWREALGHELRNVPVDPNGMAFASWLLPGAATQPQNTIPGNAQVIVFARVVAELLIDALICDVYAGRQDMDPFQGQVDAKCLALQRAIANALINGQGSGANEPTGMKLAAVPAQIWGSNNNNPNGGPFSLADFDFLLNLIGVRNGRGTSLVMNLEAFQKWKALYYTAGDVPPVRVDPETGIEYYYHGDARILLSQYVLNNETKGTGINLTSVYAVVLDTEVGFYGLFKTACPGVFAVVEEFLKDGLDQRILRIAANIAFVMTSEKCLSRMDGVQAV